MDAIFAFHSIDSSGSVLSYHPDDFRRFVDGLLESGVDVVSLDELLAAPVSNRHRAVLTFDDGMQSVHREALPVLRERQVSALVYVVSGWVGRDNRWPGQPAGIQSFGLMTWEELAECRDGGIEIGCHTAHHVRVEQLSAGQVAGELAESRAELEQRLGGSVRHFAYPYGSYDAAAVARVGEVFDTAVTTVLRFLPPHPLPLELPRIDTYYLQDVQRHQPVYGRRTRLYLKLRAFLRGVKGLVPAS